jgi:hypothetical protein
LPSFFCQLETIFTFLNFVWKISVFGTYCLVRLVWAGRGLSHRRVRVAAQAALPGADQVSARAKKNCNATAFCCYKLRVIPFNSVPRQGISQMAGNAANEQSG